MTTTADIYDICSLYFVQAVARFEHLTHLPFITNCTDSKEEMLKRYTIRCRMYALSARLILEGLY